MYLMPPVARLVAWALTGERYSAAKLGGTAITLGGVALAQFTSSPRDPVREAPAPVD
jgi:drug/metabolite transporter (DMT)-like permease